MKKLVLTLLVLLPSVALAQPGRLSPQGGTITAVNAGDGLTGGGTSGAVTLNVVCGTGLVCAADSVSVDGSVIPDGSGTVNYVPLWTPDGNSLGDSLMRQSTSWIVYDGGISLEGTGAFGSATIYNDGWLHVAGESASGANIGISATQLHFRHTANGTSVGTVINGGWTLGDDNTRVHTVNGRMNIGAPSSGTALAVTGVSGGVVANFTQQGSSRALDMTKNASNVYLQVAGGADELFVIGSLVGVATTQIQMNTSVIRADGGSHANKPVLTISNTTSTGAFNHRAQLAFSTYNSAGALQASSIQDEGGDLYIDAAAGDVITGDSLSAGTAAGSSLHYLYGVETRLAYDATHYLTIQPKSNHDVLIDPTGGSVYFNTYGGAHYLQMSSSDSGMYLKSTNPVEFHVQDPSADGNSIFRLSNDVQSWDLSTRGSGGFADAFQLRNATLDEDVLTIGANTGVMHFVHDGVDQAATLWLTNTQINNGVAGGSIKIGPSTAASWAEISGISLAAFPATTDGGLVFKTRDAGVIAEKMRLDDDGDLTVSGSIDAGSWIDTTNDGVLSGGYRIDGVAVLYRAAADGHLYLNNPYNTNPTGSYDVVIQPSSVGGDTRVYGGADATDGLWITATGNAHVYNAATASNDVTTFFGADSNKSFGLGIVGFKDASANSAIFHNASVAYGGAPAWRSTHGSFGSRGVIFSFDDGISFYADNVATTAGSTFTPTQRMIVRNSGRVGINTATPGHNGTTDDAFTGLHVKSPTGAAGHGLLIGNVIIDTTDNVTGWRWTNNGGDLYWDMKTHDGGRVHFRSGANTTSGATNEWFTYEPETGHSGVFKTDPTFTLHSGGTLGVDGNASLGDAVTDVHTIKGTTTVWADSTNQRSLIVADSTAARQWAFQTGDASAHGGTNSMTFRYITGGVRVWSATTAGDFGLTNNLIVDGAATLNGNVAIGNAGADAHTLLGTLNANSTAGTNGDVLAIVGGLPQWTTVSGAGGVDGSGTVNFLPMWTPDGNTLGNSVASQSGTVLTITGRTNLSKGLLLTGFVNYTTAGTGDGNGVLNDVDFGTETDFVRVRAKKGGVPDDGTARIIGGIAGGTDGMVIYLTNIDSTNKELLAIFCEYSGSTAANRIAEASGDIITIPYAMTVILVYDGTMQRWVAHGGFPETFSTTYLNAQDIVAMGDFTAGQSGSSILIVGDNVDIISTADPIEVTGELDVSDGVIGVNGYGAKHYQWIEEFMGAPSTAIAPTTDVSFNSFLWARVSGTGASISAMNPGFGNTRRPGVVDLSTGTTTTGFAYLSSGWTAINFTDADWYWGATVAFDANSVLNQDYFFIAGMSNHSSATIGCFFALDRLGIIFGTATSSWLAICQGSTGSTVLKLDGTTQGGITTVASSPGGAVTWPNTNVYRLEITEIGGTVSFYINGGLKTSFTNSSLPPSTQATGTIVYINKQSGATARHVYVDQIELRGDYSATRNP